jgi:hypothetical protein
MFQLFTKYALHTTIATIFILDIMLCLSSDLRLYLFHQIMVLPFVWLINTNIFPALFRTQTSSSIYHGITREIFIKYYNNDEAMVYILNSLIDASALISIILSLLFIIITVVLKYYRKIVDLSLCNWLTLHFQLFGIAFYGVFIYFGILNLVAYLT